MAHNHRRDLRYFMGRNYFSYIYRFILTPWRFANLKLAGPNIDTKMTESGDAKILEGVGNIHKVTE